ncbi:TPA: hypothetical protein MO340_004275 [Salmonella enterica subsp. salamae serovar 35:g,m,s,t:-]|nr:hypothetical protein [Salmonella enterica subsp. salamae serovar 35:g,m,s,t:-]HCA3549745.1 hypothetical protein [Salmonella enterica subsp. salamae serovar 35:g,m,s,t:-]
MMIQKVAAKTINISLERIKTTYPIVCPHCATVLERYTENSIELIGSPWQYFNGDCVYGVMDKLSPEQKKPNAFDHMLWEGMCYACRNDYYSVCITLINHHELTDDIYRTDVGGYICFNMQLPLPKYYIAKQHGSKKLPKSWVVSVYDTPYGKMYSHNLGMMKTNDNASRLVLKLLDAVRKVNVEDHLK